MIFCVASELVVLLLKHIGATEKPVRLPNVQNNIHRHMPREEMNCLESGKSLSTTNRNEVSPGQCPIYIFDKV